jgi:hypothetical protein
MINYCRRWHDFFTLQVNLQAPMRSFIKSIFIFWLCLSSSPVFSGGNDPLRAAMVQHVSAYYPDQLTNPQKKTRNTMSQFGYNLSYFAIPLFPITAFINPHKFGVHSYAKPGRKEKNGSLYTSRGGFIDFSHVRAAADWTVYMTFTLLNDPQELDLPPEAGSLTLRFQNLEELSTQDIACLAQKIAFERLEWHEVASWHYHHPYRSRSDQQSSFSPEDTYSNFLGTEIGKTIALRILNDCETRPYAEIATEEIQKMIEALQPVASKRESKQAYDIVDRYKQMKLPAEKRNNDVWWDSNILFRDQRYLFKRDIDLGPEINPWLVPQAGVAIQHPAIFKVPLQTSAGDSFYRYYEFTITPDTAMFYGRKGKPVHTPFSAFTTSHYNDVVGIIAAEMGKILLPGFDKRDCCDPVNDFKDVKRVGLAIVMRGRNK